MPKYHIHPLTGDPGLCRANETCPFGGDLETEHYSTKKEAREAFEEKMKIIENLPTTSFTSFPATRSAAIAISQAATKKERHNKKLFKKYCKNVFNH